MSRSCAEHDARMIRSVQRNDCENHCILIPFAPHVPTSLRAIMNGVDGGQCCEAASLYGVRFPLTGTPETRRLPIRWQAPALPSACASEPTASTENLAPRSLVSRSAATATAPSQGISRPPAASSRGVRDEQQWCYAASRGISPRTERRRRREMR